MDWNKIKESYPKAFDVFQEHLDGRFGDVGDFMVRSFMDMFYNKRDLYDFFDDNGLYVKISPLFEKPRKQKCIYIAYVNEMIDRTGGICHQLEDFDSRTEAEAAAFERAFEILNKKL